MTIAEYHNELAKRYEGGLFVNIFLSGGSCGCWFAHKDYYTVKSGIVYSIEGAKLTESGDSIESISAECKRVG